MKETENTNKWKDIPYSWIKTTKFVKVSVLSKNKYNPYQNTNGIFNRIRTNNFKFAWKHKIPQMIKTILRKKNTSGRIRLPNFGLYYKASHKNSIILIQKQKYRSMKQDRNPRNKPIGAWVYFWDFYPASLIYISVFV